ncbi:DUF397 domain-containing protein [Streptomyces sp. AM 3-1-1]|uniref:DUF397 domain-containing protein n=1 Tax=Streptomyces sp. AM 3-1-1 TaxID=3028711 RepID=UPI0023B9C9A9|nr:DUF397 domain-containing protein [Streptomyces sp. AM 3-1-1]WEH29071.1 DUF397 domain-containing protein [Streptomyces sp. AM 3-1-1]
MTMTANHAPVWVKSTYSNGQGAECLEWAPQHAAATGEVLVRDSKRPEGPRLSFTEGDWRSLVALAKAS